MDKFLLREMLLLRGDGINSLKESVGVLLYLMVAVGSMQCGTERGPVAGGGVDVQGQIGISALGSSEQILAELIT